MRIALSVRQSGNGSNSLVLCTLYRVINGRLSGGYSVSYTLEANLKLLYWLCVAHSTPVVSVLLGTGFCGPVLHDAEVAPYLGSLATWSTWAQHHGIIVQWEACCLSRFRVGLVHRSRALPFMFESPSDKQCTDVRRGPYIHCLASQRAS